ncbi:MAG: Response regulatory protein, partial [Thermodesulfobacteriota bacterium]|nr:Response regulatory protein [Thermodesulfobacteriota bacterium]
MVHVARILVVDADADSRLMVTRFLKLHDHKVSEYAALEHVPSAAGADAFEVAVINQAPGRTNVDELVKKIMQENNDIKVIAITDATPNVVNGSPVGHEFIFRPAELATIENTIRKVLGLP